MSVVVRQAELEDWSEVKNLWFNLKDSPHAMKIEGDLSTLKAFFVGSLTSPHVCMWVSIENGVYTGFVITQINLTPEPTGNGQVVTIPLQFIRAVYVDNRIADPGTVGIMDTIMCNHSREQGCKAVFGHCRKDFPARAALKQYGYEPAYLVMRKEL